MEDEVINLIPLQTILFQDFLDHHRNGFKGEVEYIATIHVEVVIIPYMSLIVFYILSGCLFAASSTGFDNKVIRTTSISSERELTYFSKAFRANQACCSTIAKDRAVALILWMEILVIGLSSKQEYVLCYAS